MKALEAFITALLSLLLFVCLALLGTGITLNTTLLNSKFINANLERLDVTGIVKEIVLPKIEATPELAGHPGTIASIEYTLKTHEPELKAAVKHAINDVYACINGKQEIALEQTLEESVLKPELAISIFNDLDLMPMIEELAADIIPPVSTIEITPYTGELVTVLEPWIKQEIGRLIPDVYGYILGREQTPDFSFSLDPVKEDIQDTLKTAFLKSPPPEYAALSQDELSLLFDTGWEKISGRMPETLVIDQNAFPLSDGKLSTAIEEAETALQQARLYTSYFKSGLWLLSGLTALIIAGIILVNWKTLFSGIALGIVFSICGIITLTGSLVAKNTAQTQLALLNDIPIAAKPWVIHISNGLFRPMLTFAAICIAAGIACFLLAFVFQRRSASS